MVLQIETSQNPAKERVNTNSNESIDKSNEKYDAIFLAPFSPGISPELYSIEFLKGLKSHA